jgi:polygalacturonase
MKAYLPVRDYLRPTLLSLRNCRRVLLDGPTFQNSPAWCLHPMACEQITVRNVQVRNPWFSQNGDGIDLESCSYALVEHCSFDVGDDAICLKSGKDEEGRRLGKPCRYITIRHCTVYHGHGGVVIGSEMSGGVHAVRVNDCLFIGTDIGLRFKSARGRGGVVEDIVMENITMSSIIHEAVSFHMFYAGVEGSEGHDEQLLPVTEETPQFRDITLRNIVCQGANTALLVNGLPELPLAGLTVENLRADSERGIILRNADGLKLDGIRLQTAQLPALQITKCSNVTITDSDELLLTRS